LQPRCNHLRATYGRRVEPQSSSMPSVFRPSTLDHNRPQLPRSPWLTMTSPHGFAAPVVGCGQPNP